MADASPRRLIGVFVAIVAIAVVGGVALGAVGGSGQPDGAEISGQSPGQFQPENVNKGYDPETGDIEVDAGEREKRVLVDTRHGNQFSRANLEPVVEAAFESGHSIEFDAGASSDGRNRRGSGDFSYGETLSNYDGVLIIQPTGEFSESERNALRNYTEAGGRVVVLAEPTQIQAALGLFGAPSPVSFGATNLTRNYGLQVGAETLYNMNDDRNDNNFKSIYASPSADTSLTEGVETISFDQGGYVVVNENHEDAGRIEVLYTAADGTRTLDTRREGEYPVAARNGNMVFVADSTFIEESEVYDVDNEVFVGNLVEFLVSGDLDRDFSSSGPDTGPSPPEPPEPPEEQQPTPTPPAEPTPTPPG
jgi:hypothetical protein